MKNTHFILLLIGILSFAHCTNSNNADGANEENTETQDTTANQEDTTEIVMERKPIELKEWKLTKYTYKGADIAEYNIDRKPTLLIDVDKASGYGGCNRFTAKVVLGDDKSIAFSDIASTKVACPGLTHEARFFELLQAAVSYEANPANLMINCGELGQLNFNYKEEE
mgnify:CR=1 FL=1